MLELNLKFLPRALFQGNYFPIMMTFIIQSANPRTFERENLKVNIYIFKT